MFLSGTELQAEIEDRSTRIATVSQRPTIPLPNLPMMTLVIVGVLGTIVAGQSWKNRPSKLSKQIERPTACHSFDADDHLSTVDYVLLLQSERFDFRLLTFLFVLSAGLVISEQPKRHLWVILLTAIVMSVGLHAVFTYIFVIDLP